MRPTHPWLGTAFFGAILALFFYENALLLQSELRFTTDCQRDMFLIYGVSHEGVLPHTGIRVAALGWDLGPLYYMLLAPLLSIWPSPMAVHWFNLVVCALGLTAYWRWARYQLGAVAALLSIFLYTQSTGHTAFVDTVWHVGATPGVIFGLIATTGTWLNRGNPWALIVSGVLLMTLIQLHSLGLVFGPAALLTLWIGRKHLSKKTVMALLFAMLVTAVPLLVYLIPSLSDPTMGLARHQGEFQLDFGEFIATALALLSPRYLLDPLTTQVITIAFICVGAISAWTTKGTHTVDLSRLSKVLFVQLVIGSVATASVISYEMVGRYFLPIIIPLFVLMAQGIAFVEQWLTKRKLWSESTRGLSVVGLVTLLLIAGPGEVAVLKTLPDLGASLESGDELDYLLLEEQEAVVAFFVEERGLQWSQLRGRIHGLFFGPNAGIRYLERITRDRRGTRPESEQLKSHWRIRQQGDASPKRSDVLETVELPQRTRTLVLERYIPKFFPQSVTLDEQPCGWSLPYIWSQSTADQLKLVGFPMGHGPDLHRCQRAKPPHILSLAVQPEKSVLTVEISVDGALEADALKLTMQTESRSSVELAPSLRPSTSKARFFVELPPRQTTRRIFITLPLKRTLGFLDIY